MPACCTKWVKKELAVWLFRMGWGSVLGKTGLDQRCSLCDVHIETLPPHHERVIIDVWVRVCSG